MATVVEAPRATQRGGYQERPSSLYLKKVPEIEQVRHEQVVQPGEAHVYTHFPQAVASHKDTPEELRARIDAMNDLENLNKVFFEVGRKDNGTKVLKKIQTPDGDITVTRPTGGYADVDVIMFARSKHIQKNGLPKQEDGRSRPVSWMELPEHTRRAYLAGQISVLHKMHAKNLKEGKNRKAATMENCMSESAPVSSQSINLPHVHLTDHDEANVTNKITLADGMEDQQKISKDPKLGEVMIPYITAAINKALKAKGLTNDGLIVSQRTTAPFGLSIMFEGKRGVHLDNMTSKKSIEKILIAHEEAHKALALLFPTLIPQLAEKHGISTPLTKQPSYHKMMHVTKNKTLETIIAGVNRSRGGPSEACKRNLVREKDEKLRNRSDKEEELLFQEHAATVAAAAKGFTRVEKVESLDDVIFMRKNASAQKPQSN